MNCCLKQFLHSNWLAPDSYGYCSVQGGFRYQSEGGKDNSAIRGSARYDAPKSMVQLRHTKNISLTKSGTKLCEQTVDKVIEAECAALGNMTDEESENMTALMKLYSVLLKSQTAKI